MKRFISTIVAFSFLQTTYSQTSYTFIGNGFWTNAANWSGNAIPPAVLPPGDTIKIHPAAGDSCILNTSQTISRDASLIIFQGAIFIVRSGFTLTGSLPLVRTDSTFGIACDNGLGFGTLIADGVSTVLEKGFVWDTLPHPNLSLPTVNFVYDTSHSYYGNLYNLMPGKTYYVRTFAGNDAGVFYGNEMTFTTPTVNADGDSTFTDYRDGHNYSFRHIGSQVWMTQNLNYVTSSGSWCNANNSANCDTFGRLYTWDTAMVVAPQGWHIPSKSEWETLFNYLGGINIAGGSMKSDSLWAFPNIAATNGSHFSALPGGYRQGGTGNFYNGNLAGYWWSSTSDFFWGPYSIILLNELPDALLIRGSSDDGISVRCIRDY